MRKNKLMPLEKRLLTRLPGFNIKDRLLFKTPIESLLKGIYFEESQYDDMAFTVTVFVMPMCVPRNHLVLNFGNRVRHHGGGDRWNLGMENLDAELDAALKEYALPFLFRVHTLIDFVEMARSRAPNPRTLEAIGYALARAGQTTKAIEVFDKLQSIIDPAVAWQRDLAAQVRALKESLLNDTASVQTQLSAWETDTIHSLHLDAFRNHDECAGRPARGGE